MIPVAFDDRHGFPATLRGIEGEACPILDLDTRRTVGYLWTEWHDPENWEVVGVDHSELAEIGPAAEWTDDGPREWDHPMRVWCEKESWP